MQAVGREDILYFQKLSINSCDNTSKTKTCECNYLQGCNKISIKALDTKKGEMSNIYDLIFRAEFFLDILHTVNYPPCKIIVFTKNPPQHQRRYSSFCNENVKAFAPLFVSNICQIQKECTFFSVNEIWCQSIFF